LKRLIPQISEQQEAILTVICYYEVFSHPLTAEEIKKNLPVLISEENFAEDLKELLTECLLSCHEGFYFLSANEKSIVGQRFKKEALAQKMWKKAAFFSKLIGAFPFVKSVCISGYLSKGVIDEKGDIDYFIITDSSRLWICRSFLILFKKIFLFNSHKYFCTNYFVDVNNLEIPDRNIFTATEVSHLIPVVNYKSFEEFISVNEWVNEYFPNKNIRLEENCLPESKNSLKRFSEFILSGKLGESLDNAFFRLTLKRWQKKFPQFSREDFDLNLRTRKNVSKHHPRGYQQKVLKAQEEELLSLAESMKNKLAVVA